MNSTPDPRDVEIARRASGSACPDSNFDPDTPTDRYAIEAARLSREAAEARTTKEQTMTEDQIKHMVGRFLGWRLPDDFYPDGGISFKAEFNENTPWPMRHEPTGTNLFDARQAEDMVRYILEGIPTESAASQTVGHAEYEAQLGRAIENTPGFNMAPVATSSVDATPKEQTMTDEELDRVRSDEAVRLYHTCPSSLPTIIAARLAREGWTPPESVDPDLVAVREIVATEFEARGWPSDAAKTRIGELDHFREVRVALALAAYKAGRERGQ